MKRTRFLTIATFLLLILLLCVYYPYIRDSHLNRGDFSLYEQMAINVQAIHDNVPLTPVAESFYFVYPPLATALFYLMYCMPTSFIVAWFISIVLWLLVADAYCFLYLKCNCIYRLILSFLFLAGLMDIHLLFARCDIFVAIVLFLAWESFDSRKYKMSAFFIMIAASLKIVPLVILPVLFFLTPPQKRVEIWNGILMAIITVSVIALFLFGIQNSFGVLLSPLAFHAERTVQLESTWSGIQILVSNLRGIPSKIVFDHGSYNNADLANGTKQIVTILLLSGLLFFYRLAWKLGKNSDVRSKFPPMLFSLMLWTIVISPVFSPQYLMWIFPLLFIWLFQKVFSKETIESKKILLLFLCVWVAVSTRFIWPMWYESFAHQTSLLLICIHLSRSLAIFVIIFLLLSNCYSKVIMTKRNNL